MRVAGDMLRTCPLTGRRSMVRPVFPDGLTRAELAARVAAFCAARPLPQLSPVSESDCQLCGCMRGKAAAGAPYACVPLDPVDPQHAMVLAGRHVEWPADLSREEWVSFLGMAATIAGSSPRRLVMANLGLRSGASQQHVHAHVMPDPSWGLESTGDYCALCFGEVETLCGVGDAMLAFLPGGMDGEMVLYPHGHGVRPMDFVHDASFVLVRLWAALREAGVHSGMLAWHFAGHQHMHVAPALSPPAAESIAGFSVQRLAHGQLACLLGGG